MAIPRDSGGGTRTPPRPKKAKRKSPTAGGGVQPTRDLISNPRPSRVPSARGDVQTSGGDYGRKKAEKFKRTPAYKKSVRKAYTSQPVKKRREILKESPPSTERTVIVREHKRRIKTKRELGPTIVQMRTASKTSSAVGKNPERLRTKKVQTAGPNISTGWIGRWSSAAGKVVPPKKATTTAGKILETGGKVFVNAQKEALEIPTSTVATAAHVAEPALKHPTQPKAYAEAGKRAGEAVTSLPKELYKHPGKTLVEHPLGTALLVSPAGKLPVRGVRAVERRAGASKLPFDKTNPVAKVVPSAPGEKVATLPGTQLEINRPATTTGYARNIKKRVKKRDETKITNADITKRVDEDVALMGAEINREGAKLAKKAYKVERKKGKSRKQAANTAAELARIHEQAVRRQTEQQMQNEYGLSETHLSQAQRAAAESRKVVDDTQKAIDHEKTTLKSLQAREKQLKQSKKSTHEIKSRIFDSQRKIADLTDELKSHVETRMDAETELANLPSTAEKTYLAKTFTEHVDAAKAADRATHETGIEFVPELAKGERSGYVVVPKKMSEQYLEHTKHKTFHPGEATMRLYSTQWRRNVLALHPTWYVGNALEAAVRAAVSGVGPASIYRGYKLGGSQGVTIPGMVPKIGGKTYGKRAGLVEQLDPAAARALAGRVYGGGHLAMQVGVAKHGGMDIRGEGAYANALKAMQNARREKVGVKEVADAWEALSDFTMGTLSGRIEGAFQKAMMGRALAKHPLMNDHVIKTSRAALEDTAKGLTKTRNQVELGRMVDEMYGKYGKWSPGMRHWISTYTPFISWTTNALYWLTRTLPRDHPVLTAAVASAQPYIDEWLKDKGLRKFVHGAVPEFLQGAVPTSSGEWSRSPTRYTPFAVTAQFPSDVGGLVLPQISSALDLTRYGINWKGQKVKNPDGSPLDPTQLPLLAALNLLEGAVPASQQVLGVSEKYEKGQRNLGKLVKPRPGKEIKKQFDPFRKVQKKQATTTGKPPSLFGTGGSSKPSLFPSAGGGNSLFK